MTIPSRTRIIQWSVGVAAFALALSLLSHRGVFAYDRYADNTAPNPLATNCAACHGDFNSGVYTELGSGGQSWGDTLMNVHANTMLSGDCDTCHSAGGRTPVLLNSSRGGNGLMPISCVGCHGRLQDAPAGGTGGAGAGLRRHHIKRGASGCWESCHNHADADPNAAPRALVGENTLPEYYANPGTGHTIPTSACNDSEDVAGSPDGQDNDGDLLYEGADPDCPCVAGATPGEVSGAGLPPVRVTAHDRTNRILTISYGGSCCTQNINFYFAPLANLPAFNYAGRNCGLANSGSHNWNYPNDQVAYFFLFAGQDGVVEGSYGTGSDGAERDEDLVCQPLSVANECN